MLEYKNVFVLFVKKGFINNKKGKKVIILLE